MLTAISTTDFSVYHSDTHILTLFVQCMQYKLMESLLLQREIHQSSISSAILSDPVMNTVDRNLLYWNV